ncbi:MAG: response regulator [Gemmatimonadota bacterium]
MTEPLQRRRVLFVEDEPALRFSYERYFRDRYDLAFAATGAEALAQLRTVRPDVLVLDMRLPDTDGVDLLRRVREERPTIPVFVTTAYISMEPRLRVLDLAFEGYLVKPFELRELGDRIDALA